MKSLAFKLLLSTWLSAAKWTTVSTPSIVSATIAENLGLNKSLCMAIAAGHDIGHAPYGHVGESMLSKLSGKPFRHEINSAVVAQHIERKGRGLNLTYEKVVLGQNIGNRPLLLLSILLMILGVQFITMGLLAEIIMRTYYESQHKDPYIIKDKINLGQTSGGS